MKILFLDFNLPYLLKDISYPIGGTTIQINAWIKGLRINGHHVGVLSWKGSNQFVERTLDFDLIETYEPAKGIKGLKYFYYYIPLLYKKTAEYKPDVIIQSRVGLDTGIMCAIANKLEIPFVYRVANDMDADHRYKKRLVKYQQVAYRYGLKKANALVCQNNYQYGRLKEQFPQKPSHILHNPFIKNSETSRRVPFDKRKYIAWIGIFQQQKNLPLLYDIAKKLPEIDIQIAGMAAKTVDQKTQAAIDKLKKLQNIQFVGYLYRNQVPPFLSKAVALLNTSHYEGFSNTFLEAFSEGTPVVVPFHADPDHIVQEHGLGFSIKNSEDFPEVLTNLYHNKITFEEMSQICQKYVFENHNPKILSNRLIEFLSML